MTSLIPAQDDLGAIITLDGRGGASRVAFEAYGTLGEDALSWTHLHHEHPQCAPWLLESAALDPLVVDALLAEGTRPRCVALGGGLLINLRGVNLNPGADPEDMVALRFWTDGRRAISVRRRALMAVRDVREALEAGRGPTDIGALLVALAAKLCDRMAGPIMDLEDAVDDLEDQVVSAESYELRTQLGQLRRQAIALRRYLAPQRDVLNRLVQERPDWLSERQLLQLREVGDRAMRYVEDLDSARDRAAVAYEELTGRLAEQMNRTMYLLAIVATIFLPLGLVTGLLGINVGGIPGENDPWAFVIVCGLLLATAIVLWLVFRRKRIL